MAVWVIFPIVLCAVSFIGCWTVYGLALSFNHVCSLNNWEYRNSCHPNETGNCCTLDNVPTISTSGTNFPENSLFTATINAGSFLFLIFCVFHHAHILDRNSVHSLLSKIAMILGCVVSVGAFMAGNCNPAELVLLHYLGAAVSFVFVCLYMTILTSLTSKCMLTGCERVLYPLRIVSSFIQITATILYFLENVDKQFRLPLYFLLLSLPVIITNILQNIFFCVPQAGVELHEDGIFFIQEDYFFKHISAVFEWFLCVNLELYELSYTVEFYFFSSSMLSVLLAKKEEEKPLILA